MDKNGQSLQLLLKFSFASIPIFLVTSIFFLEIVLIFLSVIFIYFSIKDNNYLEYINQKFTIIFTLFYLYMVFRYIFRSELYDYHSVLFYFRFWLYVLSIYYLLYLFKRLKFIFLTSLISVILLLSIDTLIQFLFGKNLLLMIPNEAHRLTSFFGDEQILGSFMVRLLPLILIYFFSVNMNKQNIVLIVTLYILALITIFLSGEKAAILLSFLLSLCIFLLLKDFIKLKLFIGMAVISVIIFSTILTFNKEIRQRLFVETYNEMFNFNKGINQEFEDFNLRNKNFTNKFYIFSGYHNTLILTAVKMFESNKFFGVGPRAYKHLCQDKRFNINKFSCTTHPHNLYLQILSELGILGLFFLVLMYFYFIYKFILVLKKINKNNKDYRIGLVYIMFIVNFWPLIPTGNFYNNWFSIVIFLPFSFLLLERKQEK